MEYGDRKYSELDFLRLGYVHKAKTSSHFSSRLLGTFSLNLSSGNDLFYKFEINQHSQSC
jgi:hypothetical protein